MEEINTSYSGKLKEGWNLNGTYDRIQYFDNNLIYSYQQIVELVNEGIKQQTSLNNNSSRIDIRVNIYDTPNNLKQLENLTGLFGNIDTSIKKFNGGDIAQLIIGKNGKEREVLQKDIKQLQEFVKGKIQINLDLLKKQDGFENYALKQLNYIKNLGYTFEKNNFTIDEVYNLWNSGFGWNKTEIQNLLSSNIDNLYGLRNTKGELIALVLITDGESTEWATKKEFQRQGLIEPLLIFSNSNIIDIEGSDKCKIYVQARYNRSISPSVKTGMRFITPDNLQFMLTNHVTIDNEYQSFAEGVLDNKLYTRKIIDSYLQFNTN
ncbi:hypothetical protein EOM39_01535 [Candidatus Gracilibacteria bacterium]|nr:hypothetical protein [Candidatus Gracilibacteria bacterium]